MEEIHLIEPTILFSLGLYIRPDRLLIHPKGGNKIPSGSKIVTHKILSLSKIHPGYLNGTLALEKPYHPRNHILRRNRDQQAHSWEAFLFFSVCQFPEMSNSLSPPAEPGVYPKEIKQFRQWTSISDFGSDTRPP